ncbi:MAG TPA: RsmD family RNA methyltransferase [Patescibacteria group bacterium]|nr:RsmD family RNA methyltransferase [Patescibacteria group bacterium]
MKIIEGSLAGAIVNYKEQKGTRVTTDKVRKAVFDVLKGLVDLESTNVADLFCGSGMYGIEAASRGAESVTFVDESKMVIKQLKNNLKIFNFKFSILNISYEIFIKKSEKKFDLIFADPPYYQFDFGKLNDIYRILNKNGIFILESSKRIKTGKLENLDLIVEKVYGDTRVMFFEKT